VLNFFRYIADRTDIALGMFNSPSSGYVLTPARGARIYAEIPAVCATKEGAFRPASSRMLHELAPDLTIWECDLTVYRAGWLRAGIVGPAQLGHGGLPLRDPAAADHFRVLGAGLDRQVDRGDGLRRESGIDQFGLDMGRGSPAIPAAGLLHALGRGFKYAASVLGCRSATTRIRGRRKPSSSAAGIAQIDAAYRRYGLVAADLDGKLRKALPIGVQ
jgi:4-hydroxy-tetrahydrodipicolinate synthase